MGNDDEGLQSLLDAARLRYAGRLDEALVHLAQLTRHLGRGQVEVRDELRALAHRVRGTAGSYGFSEVSAAMARIENLLDAGLEADWRSVSIEISALRDDL